MNKLRIKLCGMTRPQDAQLASDLGADAIGMIFYDKSPRNVSVVTARKIISSVSPLCSSIAVLVNPSTAFVLELIEALNLQLLQFHGDETPEFCAQFALPYIKAISMRQDVDLLEISKQYASAHALLLDTYSDKQKGGTGKVFDWGLTKNISARHKCILAGGLNLDNVQAAINQTGIPTLDVNSGIEIAPGVKDHDKMRQIMQLKYL